MELVRPLSVARVVCLGEAMVELSGSGDAWRVGYGGDTLNTAVHLARAGHGVSYMTALGNDPFSLRLRAAWEGEGVASDLALIHPERHVGLYAIETDAAGERNFTYWRGMSAARDFFDLEEASAACAAAAEADLLCFSLISLAILPPKGRRDLLALAASIRRQGGRVAFDGNYRPQLWESVEAARAARDAAIAMADFGLPTLEDEMLLSGLVDADAVAARWSELGCAEVVVKLGAAGCRLPDGSVVEVPERLQPVDTSGAGDAFNGGFLAARLGGAGMVEAATAGHRLAGWTVMRGGAIPARDEAAPY